ncbi:TolC family protein [Acidovorax sp. SDU_ACID1]|uniref:TolC family protein n=1 Tax=Acidovorax sp. SDU_ACID1 TaxID=3136632 RepID=UPI00387362B1
MNPNASWLLALALAAGAAPALAEGGSPLSFAQAQQLLLSGSDQLAASAKAVESARLRREGMQGLGGPSVAVTGMGYRYSASADISLDPARHALDGVLGHLPPELGAAAPQLPQLPSSIDLQRKANRASASVSLLWPLYIGGLGDAVRGELDAMADEAVADAAASAHGLQSLLVQRYFGAQLAERAARLRERALAGVREHDAAAQRMLRTGVISQLERLQAQAALADAEQQARRARGDADLAATALARTLKAAARVQPTSPLFVASQPLPPLQGFIDAAHRHHPGLDKVQAKRRQAGALHEAQEALRRPQVLGFGMREVNTGGKPNWVAGVAVRWTLWDSIDRDALAASSQRKIEQAELTREQALSDIALLVEKNWLVVDQARTQYFAQQAQENLARELLRLRTASLREGTGTALELIDAELNLTKVQTERAQTAHQYVQALAALLESTGQSDEFDRYRAQADIQIASDAP